MVYNQFCYGKKSKISPECIKVDGSVLRGHQMANHFNDYFITAAARVTRNLINSRYVCFAARALESCYLYPTNFQEVMKILKGLKNKGSKVLDIPAKILKDNALLFSTHLTDLYNLSLSEKIFPRLLKIGRVSPAHKSGSQDNVDNYRPISALSSISMGSEMSGVSYPTKWTLASG